MASDLLRPGLKLVFCGYTRRLHRDVAATTTPTPATGSGASSTPPASPPASTNRKRTSCRSAWISASPRETRRVGRVGAAALGRGSVGILALTPRSGAQLIALALNARGHTIVTEGVYRFIRLPDVRFNMALGHSSNLALAELDCRLGWHSTVRAHVRVAGVARRANDRAVRGSLPSVYEQDGPRRSSSSRPSSSSRSRR